MYVSGGNPRLPPSCRGRAHMQRFEAFMKKIRMLVLLLLPALCLTACTAGNPRRDSIPNKEKPLIWFNNQPANSITGELDMDALTFNSKTWFVGNDAHQGAELQGQMILDYLESRDASVDRNGDGVIGYVLLIGDIAHNDSMARTRGVRKALGTAVPDVLQGITEILDINDVGHRPIGINLDGASDKVKDGSVTIGGQEYLVRELASQEMKSISGAQWDAATAANTINTWSASFGEEIDVIISNNDDMGIAVFNAWARKNNVPVFGYDADPSCVALIPEGFAGTINQNADVQVYLVLHLLRNGLYDADPMTGITVPDEGGNVLTPEWYSFRSEQRSFYVKNTVVNADNYADYLDSSHVNPLISHAVPRGDDPPDRVWFNFLDSVQFYFNGTIASQLRNFDDLLNMEIQVVKGDGNTESSVVDRLVNPQDFDGFSIAIIRKDNASAYMSRLR